MRVISALERPRSALDIGIAGFAGIFSHKRSWALFLAFFAIRLTSFAAENPLATEKLYSTGIYPKLAGFFGRISSLFPFSLAQWIVIVLPLSVIIYIIVMTRKIIKTPENRGEFAARLAATAFCLTGVIWFGFTALCGLNYHRLSFTVCSGLEVRPSSAQELTALCDELLQSANTYSARVKRDSGNVTVSSFPSYHDASDTASGAYRAAGERYPVLAGYTPRTKPVFFSRGMSMMNIVGVYFPFTFESNINVDVPDYEIPSSMLHELAHYKGFMREDEANFISYIACLESGNDDFVYSGLMLALIHSSNALYSADPDAFWALEGKYSEQIRADIKANSLYWKQFEGPVAEVSTKVNDVYLKTNRQTAGVKSYGRMVDLLLAEYRQRNP